MPRKDPPGQHGLTMYRQGCKCEVCRAENAKRYRSDLRSRITRLAADPTIRPHGVVNTYHNWGCRCDPCCDAAGKPRGTPPPNIDSMGYIARGQQRPGKKWGQHMPREGRPSDPAYGQRRDPRRVHLLYKNTNARALRSITPFGREWINDDPVRTS